MAKRTRKESSDKPDGRIELSVPWGRGNIGSQSARLYPPNSMPYEGRRNLADVKYENDFAKVFVQQRSQVHETFIRESEKTKRLGYGLSAALLGGAFVVPVFAPLGREALSWWVSAALFVFAAGMAGYTRISVKTKEQNINLAGSTKDD